MQNDTSGNMSTTTRTTAADAMSTFTCREWSAFLMLRRRYREGQDLWDARELEHLRFLRWLRQMGRLES